MRVGIFGAGAIGCYVGGRLASSGTDVVLVGRPRLRDEIAEHGLVTVDLDRESLSDCLKIHAASLLYIAPLRAVDVAALTATASAAGVTTVSGVPQYVSEGVAVGVRLQRDRPRILINLQGARLQGADFAAELLKLADVR